jgi:hypothetical protein
MPKLTTLKFIGDRSVARFFRSPRIAPMLFTAIAGHPTIHLGRLNLFAVRMSGDVLADMLEAQKDNLQIVSFNMVTLHSQRAWQRVLEIMHSAELSCIELAWLRYKKSNRKVEYLPFPTETLRLREPRPRTPRWLLRSMALRAIDATDMGTMGMEFLQVGRLGVEATDSWVKTVLEVILRHLGSPVNNAV